MSDYLVFFRMSRKFALRGLTSIRRAHTAPVPTSKIYNAPIHNEVMKNWKPQTPAGPCHDGWALKVFIQLYFASE